MSTNHKNERIPEPLNEVRIPLPDGRVLVFVQPVRLRVVSVTFGNDAPAPPRPAPAGCPRCAHALSLLPDLSERVN